MRPRWLAAGLAMTLWLAAGGVLAGSTSGGEPQFEPEQIVAFAKKVERAVAERGARVALISRVGRPRADLPDGIRYTHVGFVVYSMISTADGRVRPGYAVYNLYQDDARGDTSFLKQDYPLDYYSAVHTLEAGIIIPAPELQRRLLEVIFSDTYPGLHNPTYSAISNPFTSEYQNCTEFVLDVINAAVYRTDDPARVKAHVAAYFEPQPVNIGPIKLLLGSLFMPDIKLSDHAGSAIRTATFGSISRYMQQYDLADEVFTVSVE